MGTGTKKNWGWRRLPPWKHIGFRSFVYSLRTIFLLFLSFLSFSWYYSPTFLPSWNFRGGGHLPHWKFRGDTSLPSPASATCDYKGACGFIGKSTTMKYHQLLSKIIRINKKLHFDQLGTYSFLLYPSLKACFQCLHEVLIILPHEISPELHTADRLKILLFSPFLNASWCYKQTGEFL